MKRVLLYLFLLSIIVLNCMDVNAQEYKVKELIPVDSVASVSVGKFTYSDFVYNSGTDSKGNSVINFNSIINNVNSKEYVSVNILLFDKEQRNIGFLTYCSKKDLDTDYSNFELAPQKSAPFSIKVTKRYFAGNNLAGDVKYLAVFDDNKYCQIGGYTKYAGLTLDEIKNGQVTSTVTSDDEIDSEFLDTLMGSSNIGKILFFIIGIALLIYVVNGILLNALYKRMYAKTTPMAFIPVLSNYVAVKLAFGEMLAKIYLVGLLGAFILSIVGINILLGAVNFLAFVASVVVIIKLITKKYDLFYYEPSIKNSIELKKRVSESTSPKVSIDTVESNKNSFFNGQVDNSLVEEVNKDDVVDLSYEDVNDDFSSNLMSNNIGLQSSSNQSDLENSSISSGGTDLSSITSLNSMNENNNMSSMRANNPMNNMNYTNNINDAGNGYSNVLNSTGSSAVSSDSSDNGEESDLTKFFK